jgi:hypothetical protein
MARERSSRPVGDGCYDIAVASVRFRPSKPHHGTLICGTDITMMVRMMTRQSAWFAVNRDDRRLGGSQ